MDYLHTYQNVVIRFYRSGMKLYVVLYDAYLVKSKVKSRIAGNFYCSDNSPNTLLSPSLNGSLHIKYKVLWHVVTSAVEAEARSLFYNCQITLYLQLMLATLGHPPINTSVKTDNGMAAQFVKDTIRNKRSKLWDVRYHWLTEHQVKGDLNIYWDRRKNNLVDYHTKHHSPTHHKKVRKNISFKIFSFEN